MFNTETALGKKPASDEIGLFPSDFEEKTNLHECSIFHWEPHRLLEIRIPLDLQRLGVHVT